MWNWLKKNWGKIQDENIKAEIRKILDDEEVTKKRRERVIAKFEKLMKDGPAIIEEKNDENEIDDTI